MKRNPDEGDYVRVTYTSNMGDEDIFEGKVSKTTVNMWEIRNMHERFVVKTDGDVNQFAGGMPFKIGDSAEFTLVE